MFDQSSRQVSSSASRMAASKAGMRRAPFEKRPVDVGKLRQILVEVALAFVLWRVQYLEQLR